MKISPIPAVAFVLISLSLAACNKPAPLAPADWLDETHKIVVTNPELKSVTLTEPYVCQIRSRRHIEICALETGYLEAITVNEGQQVKEGEPLFRVIPTLYQKKADAEMAQEKFAQLKFNYTKRLSEQQVVSNNEVGLLAAQLAEAEANADLARAVLNFATVKAPFDGIIDRLHYQKGSLVEKGDVLTTLSDNSVMWVYFNVPESRYFEYMANKHKQDLKIVLMLANGEPFDQVGKIAAIEADFNNENGNIAFRADFPNPDRLLRYGETGTILLKQVLKDALVIPQRATFQILQNQYVFVVDKNDVAHQRQIVVQHELEDLFVIQSGLSVEDKIVYEGLRHLHDEQKVHYRYRSPTEIDKDLKFPAE